MQKRKSTGHHLFEVILYEAFWKLCWLFEASMEKSKSQGKENIWLTGSPSPSNIGEDYRNLPNLEVEFMFKPIGHPCCGLWRFTSLSVSLILRPDWAPESPERPTHLYFNKSHKAKSLVKSVKCVPKSKKEEKKKFLTMTLESPPIGNLRPDHLLVGKLRLLFSKEKRGGTLDSGYKSMSFFKYCRL